jgi:branched-chain amino acid transport system ATP-binding protein
MLVVDDLHVIYDRHASAARGVSLRVGANAIVALLGPNGVGKSTTLKAISGMLRPERGEITRGTISFEGMQIHTLPPFRMIELGIVQVPEGRRLFADLTIEENLTVGACRRPRRELPDSLDRVYTWFPVLRERRRLHAGLLSGGEQQMVAIGRALMARPKLLMLDEPSLGLAPRMVDQIFESLVRLRETEALSILLVEQNAVMALGIADYGYVLEGGRVALENTSEVLRAQDMIQKSYLGFAEDGSRISFRPNSPALSA